jgi:uncharacterized membrane protein (DUF485 family)
MLPETSEPPEISEEQAERITATVMRRQLALSLSVASLFVVLLFGLPLVNTYAPEMANQRILGFTLTWLILGVLVYPVAVLLSYYFVKSSDKIETEAHQEIVRSASEENGGDS